MELMIKHSEFLTILIQALMITVAGFVFVGCWHEVMDDIKRAKKPKRKGGKGTVRNYTCPVCGHREWTMDNITETKCRTCGHTCKTEPIPKVKDEESFMFGGNQKRRRVV